MKTSSSGSNLATAIHASISKSPRASTTCWRRPSRCTQKLATFAYPFSQTKSTASTLPKAHTWVQLFCKIISRVLIFEWKNWKISKTNQNGKKLKPKLTVPTVSSIKGEAGKEQLERATSILRQLAEVCQETPDKEKCLAYQETKAHLIILPT